MSTEIKTQVVVLGAGPAGYSAAFRCADLGLETVLVERYSTLGGVCLNVGCIPSKALLHVAKVIEEAKALAEHGIVFGEPKTDIDKVRVWKEKVITQLTGGLAGMAKGRKVKVVNGLGKFTGANTLVVEGENGPTTINFDNAIIAAGSRPIQLPFIPHEDPRVWDSTDALELKTVPERLLVMGGGMNETLDGDYQTFKSKDGAYVREHFFGRYPETAALVKDMTDDEIWALNRGGHDPKKIFAALKKAQDTKGKPTVILAHTIKGYGMGETAEGKNIAHQVKKMNMEGVHHFRDRFNVPVADADIEKLPYITFEKESEEYKYLHERRQALKGYVPTRLPEFTQKLEMPALEDFSSLLEEQNKEISTTIAFVRALNVMLKNKSIKDRLVPIIADEARTFGMEGLFRQIGIYSPNGQQYTPQDREQVAYYKEDEKGQILQEGINELGAASSWLAAATSYSTNDLPMIPFYIYYSMFGFQRIGDLCWAAGDQQARGFLIGGTSGRTTLNGEGLQHEDGHSHIQSLTIPNCISYDPAYAYEVAVIMHDGLVRMYGDNPENVYYYLTTLNENYHMPAMPQGAEEGIRKGIYKLETLEGSKGKVQLLGSGAILRHVREAAQILAKDYGVGSDTYSVTSFTELARDGQDCERWNMLHPTETPRVPYIAQVMSDAPAVASTDYMKLFAEQVRTYVPASDYRVLGTDGFGRSDSRENLRHHFEVDASYVVVAALGELAKRGEIEASVVADAIKKFDINPEKVNPRLA